MVSKLASCSGSVVSFQVSIFRGSPNGGLFLFGSCDGERSHGNVKYLV